eukprot:jgi/Mesen1/2089/ME000151S01352
MSRGFLDPAADTWGEPFPESRPDWDLIIASDILLYVKQYPNLVKSLCFLLKSYTPGGGPAGGNPAGGSLPRPCFLMSWRRRIPKADEAVFFDGCRQAGLLVQDLGSKVYLISLSNI